MATWEEVKRQRLNQNVEPKSSSWEDIKRQRVGEAPEPSRTEQSNPYASLIEASKRSTSGIGNDFNWAMGKLGHAMNSASQGLSHVLGTDRPTTQSWLDDINRLESGVAEDWDLSQYNKTIERSPYTLEQEKRDRLSYVLGSDQDRFNYDINRSDTRFRNLDYITDDQKRVISYYVQNGDYDSADQYLNAIERDLNEKAMGRYKENLNENSQKLADSDNWLVREVGGDVYDMGTALSGFYTSGLGYAEQLGQIFDNAVTGNNDPVDPNALGFRGTVANEIGTENLMEGKEGARKIATEIVMQSLQQYIPAVLMGGESVNVLFGLASAGQSAHSSAEKGNNPIEGLIDSTVKGLISYESESRLSADELFGLDGKKKFEFTKEGLKLLAKNMLGEAYEEAEEAVLDAIWEKAFLGGRSEFAENVNRYIDAGMTEGEAEEQARIDFLKQTCYSMLVARLSAGVDTMGGRASDNIRVNTSLMNRANRQAVISEGQAFTDKGSEAYKNAEELRLKQEQNGDISRREAYQQYRMNEAQTTAEFEQSVRDLYKEMGSGSEISDDEFEILKKALRGESLTKKEVSGFDTTAQKVYNYYTGTDLATLGRNETVQKKLNQYNTQVRREGVGERYYNTLNRLKNGDLTQLRGLPQESQELISKTNMGKNGARALRGILSKRDYSSAEKLNLDVQRFDFYYELGIEGADISNFTNGVIGTASAFRAYSAGKNDRDVDLSRVRSAKTRSSKEAGFDYKNSTPYVSVDKSRKGISLGEKNQINSIAKSLGVTVRLDNRDSATLSGNNGVYLDDSRTIVLSNDLTYGEMVQRIFVHEALHRMMREAPREYRKLASTVTNNLLEEGAWNSTVSAYQRAYNDGTLNRTQVFEEVVADYVGKNISLNDFERMLSVADNKTLQKARDFLTDIFASKEMTRSGLDRVKDAFRDVVERSRETISVASGDSSISFSNDVRYSYRSAEYDWGKNSMVYNQISSSLLSAGVFANQTEVDGLRDTIWQTMDYIKELYDGGATWLDIDMAGEMTKDNRITLPFKDNSDNLYKISLDYSTLCKKRVMQQFVIDRIQEKLYDKGVGGILTREQQLAIRKTLKVLQDCVEEMKNLEVACGLCFVESARLKSPKQANRLLKDKGGFVTYYFSSNNKEVAQRVAENTTIMKQGFANNKIDLTRLSDEQKKGITAQSRTTEDIAKDVIPYSARNEKYFEKDQYGRLTGRMLDKKGNPITEKTSNGQLPSSMKKFLDNANQAMRREMGAGTLSPQQKTIVDIANKLTDLHFSVSDNLLDMAKGRLPSNPKFTEINKEINQICKSSGVSVKEAMQTIYTAYARRLTQATKSKPLQQGTVYYWGDASTENIAQSLIDSFNRNTGLRHQSWSDFEVTHLLDTMTAIAELSARQVKMQAYTKVPNMIRILGNTGMMINSSLIPTEEGFKTVNGRKVLDFDNKEGMPIDIALNYRHNFSNTNGTICIGINAEHIRMLLATDVMDYVIPYHASGMPKSLQKLVGIHGWKDATLSQEEKYIDKDATSDKENWHVPTDFGDWFNEEFLSQFETDGEYDEDKIDSYIEETVKRLVEKGILPKERIANYTATTALDLDGNKYEMENAIGTKLMRASALNYMTICNERGMKHKFTEYAMEGNYWKLLIDTKMVNNEGDIIIQKPVMPKFNFNDGQVLTTTEGETWLDANGNPMTTSIKDFITEERADDVHRLWDDTANKVIDIWQNTDIIDRFASLRNKAKDNESDVDKQKDNAITADLKRYAKAHFKTKVDYDTLSALPVLGRSVDYQVTKRMSKVISNDVDATLDTEERVEFSDANVRWSKATPDEIPKKTIKAYKVFVVKNGQLYPPMVANPSGAGTPVGVWLTANIGRPAYNEDGTLMFTKETGRLKVKAGGKGTKGGSGELAFRSGWHLGEFPDAKQFGKKGGYDENGKYISANENKKKYGNKLRWTPNNMVYAECEISADIDYQLDALALGVNKNGEFDRTQAGLPYVPMGGYYKYRTNPDPDTAPWYIAGQMKITKILNDEEVREICARYGVTPYPRENRKDIDLEKYGLSDKPITTEGDAEEISEDQKKYEEDMMALFKTLKGYQKRKINFDDPEIQNEFRINSQDIEAYRKLAEESDHGYLDDDKLYGGEKFPELDSYTFTNYAEVPDSLANNVRAGFHAGDLGKAEYAGNMGGLRSTGHFGTGTYFVRNLDKLSGGSYGDRPVTAVDFSKYNLFTPETQEDAVLIHDFLKDINKGFVSKNLKKEWKRESTTRVQKILGIAKKTEMWNIIDGLDQDYSDWYGDSMSTRFMKALGYEGVDVRHLERLDNTTYGSVIYDLKGVDLEHAKNFENKGRSRYSKDVEGNFGESDHGTIRYSLAVNARQGVEAVLTDITYNNEVLLRDNTPSYLLAKGVKDRPMTMNASHVRTVVLTEKEIKDLKLSVKENDTIHGLGIDKFLEVIDTLDDPYAVFRGKNNTKNPARGENYFLIVSKERDEEKRRIIVPIFTKETSRVNRVYIDTNKIATVFGRNSYDDYIAKETSENRLVRVKVQKNSSPASEGAGTIPDRYSSATKDSVTPKEKSVKRYSKSVDSDGNSLTVEQEEYFANSKVRDADGNLMVMYHGTTRGGFNTFDRNFANTSGNSGAGFYFSSSREDSESNYRDIEGADNYFKWSELRDRIWYDGEWDGEPVSDHDEAVEIAKAYFDQDRELYEVYLNIENPYIRDSRYGEGDTNLADQILDSWEQSKDDIVYRSDYEDEDDYEEALRDAKYEFIAEYIYPRVREVVQSIEDEFDYIEGLHGADEYTQTLVDMVYDYESLEWRDLVSASEVGSDFISVMKEDWENMDTLEGEFARRLVERFGYDGIVDKEVYYKFNQVRNLGDPDTFHAIAFHSNQIKRVSNTSPTSNEDIRYSKQVGTDLGNRGIYESSETNGSGKRIVEFAGEKRVQSTKVENFARDLAKNYGNGISIRSVYTKLLSLYNRQINSSNTNEIIDFYGEAGEIADRISGGDRNLADALTNLIVDNYYDTPRARKSDMDRLLEEMKKMDKVVEGFKRLSLREKIRQVRKDNKNLNTILDIARTFKEWGKGERNASEFADPVIKGFVNELSKVKRSSDISRTKARKIVANLKSWYTEENLGEYYNQAIADRIAYIYERKDNTKYPNSEELQYIADVMKGIKRLYKTYDQMVLDGKKVSIRETAEAEYKVLERSPYSEVRIKMLNKVSDQWGYSANKVINNAINNLVEPRVVYGSLEGFAPDGLLMKLFNETTDAETRMNALYIDMTRGFDDFFKDHKGYKKHYATDTITVNGKELTIGEAISLYWTANRQEAKATLESLKIGSGVVWQRNGVTQRIQNVQDINGMRQDIWDQLTDEDKELARMVHDFFTITSTDIKLEADDRILGFTNISGDRNDYFPFIRDRDQIGRKYADAKSLVSDVTSAYNYSFNKDIKEGVTLALQLIPVDQMWKDHARKMAMYSRMTEVLQTWDKVLNVNLAVDSMGKKQGQESLRVILREKWRDFSKYHSHFMQDVQNRGRGESNPFANFVRGAYATAQLGFNAKVILSQTASYPTALMYLDAESMAEAVGMKTDYKALDMYSPYAMARAYENGIVLSEGNITSTLGELGNKTTKPIAKMDRFTIGKIWNACQIYVKNHQGLPIGTEENYRERAKLHEKICRRTQPNYTQTERSGMMRSGNEIVKSFTMFTSVPLKQLSRMVETGTKWRMAREEYKRTKSEESKKKLDRAREEFFKCQIACLLANAMYVALATAVRFLLPRKDEDQEVSIERFGKEVFDVYMGLVPVWKDAYGYFANGYDVSNYFYSSVNDMLSTVKKLKDIKDDPFGTMLEFTQQRAMFSGIPVRNMKNAYLGVTNQLAKAVGASTGYEIAKKQKSIRNTSNKNYFVQYIFEALYDGDSQSASYIIGDMKSRGYTDKDIENALKTIFANEAYEAWSEGDQRRLSQILNALGLVGWTESVIDSKVSALMKKDLAKERDIKNIARKIKNYRKSNGGGISSDLYSEVARIIRKYMGQGYTQKVVEDAIQSLL